MNIGFTGTRIGLTEVQRCALFEVLNELAGSGPIYLHHGDCVGADKVAGEFAASRGWTEISHPPKDDRWRAFRPADIIALKSDPIVRNHRIVDMTRVLVACPDGEERQHSGTWATVRYARKRGKWIIIVYPDGTVREENK